jgi:predicted GH43/DUF377 family glycosyl hydrolase
MLNPYFLFFALIFLLNCHPTKKKASLTDESWMLDGFVKMNAFNPILEADTSTFFLDPIRQKNVQWQGKDVFNPSSIVFNDQLILLYRGEDFIGKYNGTSRIGLARSSDGIHFIREDQPVFYPQEDALKSVEWEGGVEDPRIVIDDLGVYWMTYTAYDGQVARLLMASSQDLFHWRKHGSVFENEIDANKWTKSGSIVCSLKGNSMVATQINGSYVMYFGDTDLFMATSQNLISWTILKDQNGDWKKVLSPRPGRFDSRLVEPGPQAMITQKGILLLYNGMNLDEGGAADLPRGTYSAGQALFDLEDPSQLIKRSQTPFLKPSEPYELEGQVNQVCFIEGLSYFQKRWYLFYGTADSKIAMAVSESNLP